MTVNNMMIHTININPPENIKFYRSFIRYENSLIVSGVHIHSVPVTKGNCTGCELQYHGCIPVNIFRCDYRRNIMKILRDLK